MMSDLRDFYPTPPGLISRMLSVVDWRMVSAVLEPSAGKGDIADAIQRRIEGMRSAAGRTTLDCIELDPALQHLLRGKGYNVVHDDFLTFRSPKQYDLIVANFPFSEGARHALHALSVLAAKGGQLVCLVNAETLRNTYSQDRHLLTNMLDGLDADIAYLTGEFADAERSTDVEAALIRATVPAPERVPVLLDGLREAVAHESSARDATGLVDANPMLAMVQRFDLECRIGLRLIDEYRALMPYMLDQVPTGDDADDKFARPLLELSVRGEKTYFLDPNDYVTALRHKYWAALLHHKQFRAAYTSNLLAELESQLTRLAGCDFSAYNIRHLESELRAKVSTGIEAAILAMFDTFTCRFAYHDYGRNIHYYNGWKTNKAHKINRKVIVPINGFNAWSWSGSLDTYQVAKEIGDLVKAFDYLSGAPSDDHWRTVLDEASQSGVVTDLDFRYFTATFYKKGTCHITFSDQKLLDKLNIYGSQRKGWLPPSYGRAAYQDMSAEERRVVDDFQGAAAYEEVLRERDYYLAEPSTLAISAGTELEAA